MTRPEAQLETEVSEVVPLVERIEAEDGAMPNDIMAPVDINAVLSQPTRMQTVTRERMAVVLGMIEPYVERYNIEVIPDSCSVTIRRKGVTAECFNISTSDRHILAAIRRVCSAESNCDLKSF